MRKGAGEAGVDVDSVWLVRRPTARHGIVVLVEGGRVEADVAFLRGNIARQETTVSAARQRLELELLRSSTGRGRVLGHHLDDLDPRRLDALRRRGKLHVDGDG